MEKKQIITIAGKPGSGKSTISKRLAATLGYKHFSSGDLFRAIAREKNLSVDKINLLAEADPSIDEAVDQKLRDLGKDEDETVIDSRMAWYWIPQSFKVYLDLDLEIAADRIYNGQNHERFANEDTAKDVLEYQNQLAKRLESETKRYMTLYQQNPYDTSHYDLIVDTYVNNPEQVEKIILEAFRKWFKD
ncbi:MAG: nucleoside monophosphate kinase [Candidatus Paceibacterota bacterium]